MRLASACRFPTSAAAALLSPSASGPTGCSSMLTRPILLVSDLDDTLVQHTAKDVVGADAASTALKAVWERSQAAGVKCKLAINTGRTLPLFEAAWQAKSALLPQPDLLIAGVGTRCYHLDRATGSWVEDPKWTARMGQGWDAAGARAVMDALLDTFGPDNVEYRPEVELNKHKLTVLYRKALRERLMPHLTSSLQQAGVQATVIEGGSGRGPEWQFIDLLPTHAGKGRAMRYIQQQLGFDDASTVAAGDANNDMLMLQEAPHAILVGNAVPDLKRWAVGQRQVYVATQPIAAGVMEGLRALGMLDVPLPN